MRFSAKPIITIIIAMVFFILDRLVKYLLINNIWRPNNRLIALVKNKGAAFGIIIPEKLEFIFYLILIIILIILIYWLIASWRKKDKTTFLAVLIILTGAISNMIDRVKYGAVVDFIDLKFWPVFNLGDAMIVLGGLALLIDCVLELKHKK